MLDGKYLFCECLNFQQRFVIIPVEIDVMIKKINRKNIWSFINKWKWKNNWIDPYSIFIFYAMRLFLTDSGKV